jgi:hypothetical protein
MPWWTSSCSTCYPRTCYTGRSRWGGPRPVQNPNVRHPDAQRRKPAWQHDGHARTQKRRPLFSCAAPHSPEAALASRRRSASATRPGWPRTAPRCLPRTFRATRLSTQPCSGWWATTRQGPTSRGSWSSSKRCEARAYSLVGSHSSSCMCAWAAVRGLHTRVGVSDHP